MCASDFSATLGFGIMQYQERPASAWSVLGAWQRGLFLILTIGVVLSALSVVLVQHIHRQQLRQIHVQINWQDRMDHQWAQLLAEKGSLASLERVEQHARQRLGMVVPDLSQVTFLEVEQGSDPWRVVHRGSDKSKEAGQIAQLSRQNQVGALPYSQPIRRPHSLVALPES